jgi:hypothetical protein
MDMLVDDTSMHCLSQRVVPMSGAAHLGHEAPGRLELLDRLPQRGVRRRWPGGAGRCRRGALHDEHGVKRVHDEDVAATATGGVAAGAATVERGARKGALAEGFVVWAIKGQEERVDRARELVWRKA